MAEEFNTGDMLDVYLYENTQLLEKLQDTVLDQKDADEFDEDSINEIFRAMHTIKGSSGVMMFDDITTVAHRLEDVFFFIRESHPRNVPHMELVELVLDVADFISGEMDKLSDGDQPDGDSTELVKTIEAFLEKIKGESAVKKATPEKKDEAPRNFYIAPVSSGGDNYFKIYLTYNPEVGLANIHAYKLVFALKEKAEDIMYAPDDILTNEQSADEILKNGFQILLKTKQTKEDLERIIQPGYDVQKADIYPCSEHDYQLGFDSGNDTIIEKPSIAPGDFVIADSRTPSSPKKLVKDKPKKTEKTQFISVDVSKMDQLMDLIGELVISESVVLQNPDLRVPGLVLDNFNKAAGQMTKISTDLQNVIMSMRMVPLTATFQKMNRIVFDSSRKLGKEIEFEMVGDSTEVDKNIIEHISDPLMHLVRNSVDHGIESKEERIAAGKKEKGKITLSAKNESGKVWISVTDNGGGLNRQKILAKARKNGLIEAGKPDTAFTDKEVYQFITLPGFSTNEQVTELSGRGVGMDVVVSNLQKVGGALEIDSVPGEGSTMTLKIPLTLAIIDGIVMEVANSSFVIETGSVKEFVSVTEDMMIYEPDGGESVMIRGNVFPVLRVGKWYHLKDYAERVEDGMMVIVEVDNQNFCLFVDRLVGKQEIVVKPIPDYVRKVKGLTGCTQLGDGSIALILDAANLIE
ncbi:MAG: chemotaxis protein CheA [Lachnospiraceae bacterium]|nr:chemotaxis protein CheA [Lachnospiraceae bacterium]